MRKIITQATVFWFDAKGRISLEQPSIKVKAIAFRLEQLKQLQNWGESVNLVMGFRDDAHYGVQVYLDEAGRIVTSRYWGGFLPLRAMKIRVVASSAACLAEQFGARYDPHYYDF